MLGILDMLGSFDMLDILGVLEILDMLGILAFSHTYIFSPYGDILDTVGVLVKDVKLIKLIVPCVTSLWSLSY